MIGPDITRDTALRMLMQFERETMDAVRAMAPKVAQMRRAQFLAWQDDHEERLAVIAALQVLVTKLPPRTVLAKGEQEARSV